MKSGATIWRRSFFACLSLTVLETSFLIRYASTIIDGNMLLISQVVAPVRETVSQTLASLMVHMPTRSLLHVHNILLQMIRQDFNVPADLRSKSPSARSIKSRSGSEKTHIWEVRHAGLLGMKYEVAVRSDLFSKEIVKQEEHGIAQPDINVLRDVVDAAVLGYMFFLIVC